MTAGVLFLDDEQNVLNALRRVFQDEGHSLIFTTSPEEALERIGKEKIGVVVSDHRMPSMTGVQFLERVKLASPETARMLLTGHADVKIAMEAINRGSVYRFLTKPWDDGELQAVVRQAMTHYELVTENLRLTELTREQNLQLRDLNANLEKKVAERTREVVDLNKRLEKSFMGSVRVMAGLTEVHSSVIGSHSRRVASLSKGMAKRSGLAEEEVLQVEVAAVLHDVGKVSIPAEVLAKAEHALKAEERELFKRVPLLGETLVKMVSNMEPAARLVRHCCERFHGGGYPDRLKGADIPLGSRIIAAADAYDSALNAKSAYQSNSPEKVLQQLRARSPGDFDPDVVETLALFLKEGDRMEREAEEVEIRVEDLRAGMMLSRDIRNVRGLLLVPAGKVVSEEILRGILDYYESGRSTDPIFISRKDPVPNPREQTTQRK